jgi:RHS repeat-associated protein
VTYTLDLNAGLTQVLADGENTYLYGLGRIAQVGTEETDYFLGDALGSVRQLADGSGMVTYGGSYTPYGETLTSAGAGASAYGYTGEYTDPTGMVYLRARYYAPWQGRFMTRDTWGGDSNEPMSYNRWMYVYGNPIRYSDPTGYSPCDKLSLYEKEYCEISWLQSAIPFKSDGHMWTAQERQAVYEGVDATIEAFTRLLDHMGFIENSKGDVFRTIFGVQTFHFNPTTVSGYKCERYFLEPQGVVCYVNSNIQVSGPLIAHELGHVYNAVIENRLEQNTFPRLPVGYQSPYNDLDKTIRSAEGFSYIAPSGERKKLAEYMRDDNGKLYLHRSREVGQLYRYSSGQEVGEEFADMFTNWVYDGFTCGDAAGRARHLWMTNRLQMDMSLIFGIPPDPNLTICCGE